MPLMTPISLSIKLKGNHSPDFWTEQVIDAIIDVLAVATIIDRRLSSLRQVNFECEDASNQTVEIVIQSQPQF